MTGTSTRPLCSAGQTVENVVAESEPASRLVVVQVRDVDDVAYEYFQQDAKNKHGEDEVVETMALTADVEQQFEFCDLCYGQHSNDSRLRLRLGQFQFDVT